MLRDGKRKQEDGAKAAAAQIWTARSSAVSIGHGSSGDNAKELVKIVICLYGLSVRLLEFLVSIILRWNRKTGARCFCNNKLGASSTIVDQCTYSVPTRLLYDLCKLPPAPSNMHSQIIFAYGEPGRYMYIANSISLFFAILKKFSFLYLQVGTFSHPAVHIHGEDQRQYARKRQTT